MTTIVYTEEVMNTDTPSSANVTHFLVEIGMGETQSAATVRPATTAAMSSAGHHGVVHHHHRAGSPKPKSRFSVKKREAKLSGYSPTGYLAGFNPRAFTITAYLPNNGGKRLKVSR